MDDKFHRNKKVRRLRRRKGGLEALGVWAVWWSWCLDDPDLTGIVPAEDLSRAEAKAAKMLVDAELWEAVDEGYRFHDFHEYNPTAEQREAKKKADRERVAEKRMASRVNVASDNDASRTEDCRESLPARASRPIPTHPNPVAVTPRAREEQDSGQTAVARATSSDLAAAHFAAGDGGEQLDPDEVRKLFGSQRKLAERGGHIAAKASVLAHCRALAAWARDEVGPDPERQRGALARGLSGYFAHVDPWHEQAGWPIGAFAADPGKWLRAPKPRRKEQSALRAPPVEDGEAPMDPSEIAGLVAGVVRKLKS